MLRNNILILLLILLAISYVIEGRVKTQNCGRCCNGCIDAAATVLVKKDNIIYNKTIGSVEKGDLVETSNGFDLVYFVYQHKKLNMMKIKTQTSEISLTGNHIIKVVRDDQEVDIKANDINFDDKLYTLSPLGEKITEKIMDIDTKSGPTKYILTYQGDIIVNNIIISCHVDNHSLGHYATYPLRWIYHVCQDCVNQDTYFIQAMKSMYENII